MATESSENKPRQPMPPGKRHRLQKQFEHGSKMAGAGNYDYATDLFLQCVLGDPGNLIYVQNFLGNLHRKYDNNKKGSKLAGMKGVGAKGGVKKALMKKDWEAVFKSGLDVLKLNPWDSFALTSMAAACENLEFDECQLAYLKSALDAHPKDADINRLCARALGRMGQFDQAIICWHRVELAKPGDEEASRAIGDLTVEKTIHEGKYESAESSTDVMADKQAQDERRSGPSVKLTAEQQLERDITRDPSDTAKYVELADLHQSKDAFAEAEQVLTRALEASGNDLTIRERLEDVQLRRYRQQVELAKEKAVKEKTQQAVDLFKKMKAELNVKELEIYASRSERYPNNVGLKYELGIRLERAGKYREAIGALQEARGDTKRKGLVLLALGQCFCQIKQYKLGMDNFEAALQAISERDPEQRKQALYLAGCLAMGLKDLDKAEKYLTDLGGVDFSYKDVAARLDKLAEMRNKG